MQNINTIPYWNRKHIESYSNRHIPYARKSYHDFVNRQIYDHGKLIDVGCGNGLFLEDVANHTTDIELTGVDFSSEVIKLNRERFQPHIDQGRNIRFDAWDINGKEPYAGEYDYVVCMEVMEHITNTEYLFNRLNSLCKKNGRIFIVVPNKQAIISDEHYHYFSSQQMTEYIEKFGKLIKYERISKIGSKGVRNLAFCYKPKK